MNTSFIVNMKNLFSYPDKFFKRWIDATTSKNICISTIAFASFYVAGCNGSNGSGDNKKKTDTVFVQPTNQEGEGMDENHEGMGDHRRIMDSTHHGMDSMNHKRHR